MSVSPAFGGGFDWHEPCLSSANMPTQLGLQSLSLEGEVVEILEGSGERLAKIVLTAPIVLGVTHGGISDLHLGDRVVVHGLFAIARVGPLGGNPELEEDL